MHPRLQDILTYLRRVRDDLTAVVDSHPASDFSRAPAAGWNGAQIIQHVGQVEGSTTKMLEGLFSRAMADGMPNDPETTSLLHSLDHLHVPDRTFRPIVAPVRLVPPTDTTLAPSWESLQQVRVRTLNAVSTVDGRDLSSVSAPHPIFGAINGYQWILFIGQHEERHLRQLRDALKAV